MSSPSATPNATASLVATSAVAERKLLASFIAWASPGRSPTRWRRSLRPASTGSTSRARVVGAGVHHRERAGTRAGHAARHRRVDVGDPASARQRVDRAAAATPTVDVSTTWVVMRSAAATTSRGHRLATRRRRAGCTPRRRRLAPRRRPTRRASRRRAHARARRRRGRRRSKPAPTRFAASALPMLPSPTNPTVRHGQPPSRGRAQLAGSRRRAETPAGRTAVRDELEEQLVDLGVGDARARRRRRVEAELLHASERGGHRQHQQAAITRRQRRPRAPRRPTPST